MFWTHIMYCIEYRHAIKRVIKQQPQEKSRLTSTAYLFRGWEAHSAHSSWAGSPVPVRCSWRSHCQCVCGLCARRHLPVAVPGDSTVSSEADCWSRLPAESHSSGRRAVSPTVTGRNLKLQHFWEKETYKLLATVFEGESINRNYFYACLQQNSTYPTYEGNNVFRLVWLLILFQTSSG